MSTFIIACSSIEDNSLGANNCTYIVYIVQCLIFVIYHMYNNCRSPSPSLPPPSPDDEVTDSSYAAAADICTDIEEEFPKDWLSIVQGITPVSQDNAVKLAALQYQAYFLDRTAVHSTVGFCRYSRAS